jgi:hypothetical protein
VGQFACNQVGQFGAIEHLGETEDLLETDIHAQLFYFGFCILAAFLKLDSLPYLIH